MKQKNKEFTKFLFSLYKPVKFSAVIMIVAMMLAQVFALFRQYILKDLIDLPSQVNFSNKTLLIYVIALLAVFIFETIFFYISNITRCNVVQIKQSPYITERLYNNISKKSYSFFTDNYSGKISSAINEISSNVESLNNNLTASFIATCSSMIASFILLLSIDVILFVVALVFFVGLIIIRIIYFNKYFTPLCKDSAEISREYCGVLNDSITNFVSIKLAGVIKRFASKLKTRRKDSCELIVKAHKREFTFGAVAHILFIVVFGLLLWYAITKFNAGILTIGGLVIFIQSMFALKSNSTNISWSYIGLVQIIVMLRNSYDVLYKDNNRDDEHLPDIDVTTGNVKFEKVTFGYTDKNILKNFSLNIRDKQKIGIIGISGSGKTTLSNLMLKFFEPQEGKILIDGKDIKDYNSSSLYKSITYAQQEVILLHTTLKENIKLVKPDATDEEVIFAAKKAKIHDFISGLEDGYETLVGERGIKLSGGQRQRVALARIFLKEAKIIIFDEATSSLDNDTEFEVQKNIDEYFENQTVICIAHRLSTLENMDMIYVLKDGKVADKGTPEKIIPKYQVHKSLEQ